MSPCQDVQKEPIIDRLDKLQNDLGVKDPGLSSPGKISDPRQRSATFDDCLDVPEPASAILLHTDLKNTEKRDCDKTNVLALFKKKN